MKTTPDLLPLNDLNNKKVTYTCDKPTMSSDGGLLLLRELVGSSTLISSIASSINDRRNQSYVEHSLEEIISQRVGQISCGYADANDCDTFKADPLLKMFAGKDPIQASDLCSQPTVSRLENSVTRKDLYRMGKSIFDHFINSYDKEPQAIVIDMDPTTHITYGDQQMTLFNGHVDDYCLMPFHVYDGLTGKLITATLRPGKTPVAGEIITLLKRIVTGLRAKYPKTMLIFRADSHHTKPEVMDWCEDNNVEYILGLSPNSRLKSQFSQVRKDATTRFKKLRHHRVDESRCYASGYYAAGTWRQERRVICRALSNFMGDDTRCIVTSFKDTGAKYLYETIYCGRANAELMIKDHKLGTGSDKSSCTRWEANQFRLFTHSIAYALLHEFRSTALKGTSLERAEFSTIRFHLFKVAALVEVKKTRIKIHLPINFKHQEAFNHAANYLHCLEAG